MQGDMGTGINILIVDDDQMIAELLKDLLTQEGRSIELCHDGRAAIGAMEGGACDLMVLDLVIPQIGGMEVLKYAKKANPEVVVIIMTGYASLESALTAIKEGAYDYLRKPFKLEEMKIAVDHAEEKIKLNRQNKDLLKRLQDAYRELLHLKEKKVREGKIGPIRFFPSNVPSLDFLCTGQARTEHSIDRLQALSTLKADGMLTEREFGEFKRHLLRELGDP